MVLIIGKEKPMNLFHKVRCAVGFHHYVFLGYDIEEVGYYRCIFCYKVKTVRP